jgi:hypothetical protein
MQIYSVLMAQLLMVVIRNKSETRKSFANMITVIRLHLMSYVSFMEYIKETYKECVDRRTMCKWLFLPDFERGELPLIFDRSFFDRNPLLTGGTAIFYLL